MTSDAITNVKFVSLFEENNSNSLEYALEILELQKGKFNDLALLSSQQLGDESVSDSAMFLARAEKIDNALKVIYSLRYDMVGLQSIIRRNITKHGDCRSCEWRGGDGCKVHWASDTECINGDHYQYSTNGFIPLWKSINTEKEEG